MPMNGMRGWFTTAVVIMGAAGVSGAWAEEAKELPGKKPYEKSCASCHGKDGKGNDKMAKMFKVDPKELDLTSEDSAEDSDEELTKVIVDGKNKMPAYGKKMKAEEIKSVVEYLRSLAPSKDRQEDDDKETSKKPHGDHGK